MNSHENSANELIIKVQTKFLQFRWYTWECLLLFCALHKLNNQYMGGGHLLSSLLATCSQCGYSSFRRSQGILPSARLS